MFSGADSMYAGSGSKVFVGIGVGLVSVLVQKSLCSWVQIPLYYLLVLVQEPLCLQVQTPCILVRIPWCLLASE